MTRSPEPPAIDPDRLARDVAALVAVPSVTGDERAALERLGELAAALGLEPELVEHDLAAARALGEHPGEEAPRDELWSLWVRRPGAGGGGPRLCLNGHVDVVGPGAARWRHGAWSGRIADGAVHGRGSVDMKGGLVAALHGLAAAPAGGPWAEVVLQAVSSEEDGGLGTVAALDRDDRFDACLIPEPTEFGVVCAQAGALTFRGTVPGRAAHAAFRSAGASAIDRYVRVHAALAEHERRLNAGVRHPLMRPLELPYPVLVGRVEGGRWSSQVPDRLSFEGRLGVRVEESAAEARDAFERVVAAVADDGEEAIEIAWTGGQFAPAQTPPAHPFATRVLEAVRDELGRPAAPVGVPYGADMRHFCARGIACVMCGPPGARLAHAVDERVAVEDLARTARIVARVVAGPGETSGGGRAAAAAGRVP